jgi:hypothetical protein
MVVCMAFNFTVGILTLQPWRFYIVGAFLLSIGIFICDCGRSNLCGGELFLLGEFISVGIFFLLLWANSSLWAFFSFAVGEFISVGVFFTLMSANSFDCGNFPYLRWAFRFWGNFVYKLLYFRFINSVISFWYLPDSCGILELICGTEFLWHGIHFVSSVLCMCVVDCFYAFLGGKTM